MSNFQSRNILIFLFINCHNQPSREGGGQKRERREGRGGGGGGRSKREGGIMEFLQDLR